MVATLRQLMRADSSATRPSTNGTRRYMLKKLERSRPATKKFRLLDEKEVRSALKDL